MFVALFGSFQTSFWLLYWERKTSTSAEMKEYAVSQASHLLHTPRIVTFSVPDSHCQVDHHWQPYTFPSLHFLCLVLGYPAAYILSQKQFKTSKTMVVLFILPMWVNILIRTLATVALFDFLKLPLGEGALVFGMVYNFLPFMIYPIYNTLQKMDQSLIEAAQDLGANPFKVFTKVVFPLSMPGVLSGILMVFMPTVSTFAIAELLTMNNIKLFGTTVQENIYNGMWNYGAALSLIMLLLIAIMSLFGNEENNAQNEGGGVI